MTAVGLVVGNGYARERKVTVGSGTVPIAAPRVNDKRVDGAEWRAQAVQIADSGALWAPVAEGDRGAADPFCCTASRPVTSGPCSRIRMPLACRPARSAV